jgi:hypothetical protein
MPSLPASLRPSLRHGIGLSMYMSACPRDESTRTNLRQRVRDQVAKLTCDVVLVADG